MNKPIFFKKVILIVGIAVLGGNCNLKLQHNAILIRKHSPQELKKDVDFAIKKIKKNHPYLYQYISEEELDKKIDSTKNSIKTPMTTEEFYFVLAPLVAEIKQGHNNVMFPLKKTIFGTRKDYNENNAVEKLRFESIENKIIISEVYDTNKALLFAEVLQMDGKDVSYYINKYNHHRSSDGYNTTMLDRKKGRFLLDYYLYETKNLDTVTLTLSLNDSVFDTTFYELDYYDEYYDQANLTEDQLDTSRLKGYDEFTQTYTHDYRFLDTNKEIAFLKVKSFINSSFSAFYDRFFNEIDSLNSNYLILDLRDNLGGSLFEIHYLTSWLENKEFTFVTDEQSLTKIPVTKSIWNTDEKGISMITKTAISPLIIGFEQFKKKKKNNLWYEKTKASKSAKPQKKAFKGKMFVLVNGNSFSAASIIATYLQGSKRATIVGEETGGAYNGCVAGTYDILTLPYSKLEVVYGLHFGKTHFTDSPDGYGVIPDIKILPTIEDRKNGIDTELELILDKIKEEKESQKPE